MRVAGTFVLGIISSPFSSAEAQELVLQPTSVREVEHESTPISGPIVVGVRFAGPTLPSRPNLIATLPLDHSISTLCVTAISADGLYEAELEYNIPGTAAQIPINLAYVTKYPGRVAGSVPDAIAIRLLPRPCSQGGESLLIANWNTSVDLNAPAIMLINSLDADEVEFYVGTDPSAPARACEKLSELLAIAYDYRCAIPRDALEAQGTAVEINTYVSGSLDQSVMLTLEFAR